MQKARSPGQTVTTISLPETLLAEIDKRRVKLGLSRSAYLCALARADIAKRGTLTLSELTEEQAQIIHDSLTGVPPATTISSTSGAVLRNDYDLASLDVNFTPGPAQPIGFTAIPIHEEPATEVTRTRPKKRTK